MASLLALLCDKENHESVTSKIQIIFCWDTVGLMFTLRLTIYAPMIYTAPCIIFWMRAYPLQGQVEGGWALEFASFLGPVKWHRADWRVPFGAQKTREWICMHPKHYAQGCINHKCIGGFMHKSPQGRFQGPYLEGWRSRCIKELVHPARAAPPFTKFIRNQFQITRQL